MSKRTKEIPAEQGIPTESSKAEVGYCQPPEDSQFKPGQSGNPAGPPKRRTNRGVWFCKYMEMTDAEIRKLKRPEMTQVQQSALKLVRQAKAGKYCGSERLARYIVDREEGKATEHLIIDKDNELSDEECENIRAVLRKAYDDAG